MLNVTTEVENILYIPAVLMFRVSESESSYGREIALVFTILKSLQEQKHCLTPFLLDEYNNLKALM